MFALLKQSLSTGRTRADGSCKRFGGLRNSPANTCTPLPNSDRGELRGDWLRVAQGWLLLAFSIDRDADASSRHQGDGTPSRVVERFVSW